ncbi:hypothetical protein ACFL3C_02110 [Patescibacteria group bacterium]
MPPEKPQKRVESKEAKEALKQEAMKACGKLCLKYHQDHASGYNMDSLPKDKALYTLFRKFFKSKYWPVLPQHFKNVLVHRYLYVRMMVELGSKPKIRKFVKEFQPGVKGQMLADSNFDVLHAKLKNSSSFAVLEESDLQFALETVSNVADVLGRIPSGGKWGAMAQRDMGAMKIADKIDDQVAAPRLRKGLRKVARNIIRIMQLRAAKTAERKEKQKSFDKHEESYKKQLESVDKTPEGKQVRAGVWKLIKSKVSAGEFSRIKYRIDFTQPFSKLLYELRLILLTENNGRVKKQMDAIARQSGLGGKKREEYGRMNKKLSLDIWKAIEKNTSKTPKTQKFFKQMFQNLKNRDYRINVYTRPLFDSQPRQTKQKKRIEFENDMYEHDKLDRDKV